MKRLVSVFLILSCPFLSLSMVAFAGDAVIGNTATISTDDGIVAIDYAPDDFVPVEDPLRDSVPPSMDFLTQQTVTRSATKVVYVNEPCDQSWRNKYPNNWMWQAHRVVIESDHILEDKIGV